MKYPKRYTIKPVSTKELVRLIMTYYDSYGEMELRFSDGTSLVCDRDLDNRCTWWHPHAFNYPKEQTIYPEDMYEYLSEILKRKKLVEVIVSSYGEERHILIVKH